MPQERAFFIMALIIIGALLSTSCNRQSETPTLDEPPPAKSNPNVTRYQKLVNEEKALLASPMDSSSFVRLGYIYLDIAQERKGASNSHDLVQKAKAAFEEALETDGRKRNAHLGLALANGIGESKNEVLALYAKIIGGPPSDTAEEVLAMAYQSLAKSYFNANSKAATAKSKALCNKMLELFPNDPVALSTLAKIHFNNKDFQKAERLAQKTIDLHAENDITFSVNEAYHLLGQIRQTTGRNDEAENFFKKSIKTEKGKNWACAYQSLGGLYRNSGKPNKAAKMDMEYSDRIPNSAEAAFLAAYACFQVGDFANAINYAERANHNKPDPNYRAFRGYLLLFERHFAEAEKVFHDILVNDSGNAGARIGRGHLAVVRKDYSLAAKLLGPVTENSSLVRKELYVVACLGMGWAMANQNEHAKAVDYFDLILQEEALDFLALMGKGNSLIGLERLDEATQVLEKALGLQPGNPYALAELAMIKLKKGQHDQAEKSFMEALKGDNKNYTCPYEGLGLLYLQQGKTDLAKKNFEKSIKINPDIEFKKYNGLAKIYIKEGKLDKAEKLLRKSMENFPWDDEAESLLESIGR